MSHDLHSAPSILSSLSLSSTSLSLTGSGSRLITSRIHCADSRGLRGDGFIEPRTGYEPKTVGDKTVGAKTVGDKTVFDIFYLIVTEQESEHYSTEESQIPDIEDKFSLPGNQSRLKILLKALLRLKKQTWTTYKFVLSWLQHGIFRIKNLSL